MPELHPIQEEMLRIEAAFEDDAPEPGPPIDACIAKMVGFDGDVNEELHPVLREETKRAVRLTHGHYSEWVPVTPLSVATIGFLQGVTFAAAVRRLQERDAE